MEENKTRTVFPKCTECGHINITDCEFYRVRCSECGKIFISDKCTLKL